MAAIGARWARCRSCISKLCYYRAIDFAIERGLARVEAGAQGEHKISRGYLPVATYSAHWIREAPLRAAVARFLDAERDMVEQNIEELVEADHTGVPNQQGAMNDRILHACSSSSAQWRRWSAW